MKILFVLNNMMIGGIENSFLSLVSALPASYEVHLLLVNREGPLLEAIPSRIKILDNIHNSDTNSYITKSPFRTVALFFKKGLILRGLHGIYLGFLYHLTKKTKYAYEIFDWRITKVEYDYDVAISYHNTIDFIPYYTAKKIRANKKIQWIHTDVSVCPANTLAKRSIYKYFDEFIVVSKAAMQSFKNVLPEYDAKTRLFYNILQTKNILALAKSANGFADNYKGYRILTVGRLSHGKGYDLAINAIRKLVDNGFDVKYYIIGSGEEEENLKVQVSSLSLESHVVFLGAKKNPYPFMSETDIYIQPSRHEGQCITVWEAKIFSKPIILTNFPTSYEAVKDNVTGLIVNMDAEGMYNGLYKIITDDILRNKLIYNLRKDNKSVNHQRLPF